MNAFRVSPFLIVFKKQKSRSSFLKNPQRRRVRREEKISEGGFLRKKIFIPFRFSVRKPQDYKKICNP